MFENYTRYRKMIGRGVAIHVPFHGVYKFKITAVNVICGRYYDKVVGVELAMPSYLEREMVASGQAKQEGARCWVPLKLLYRNKGECRRAISKSDIDSLKQEIDSLKKDLRQLSETSESKKARLEEMQSQLNELLKECRYSRWSNKAEKEW